jgi:hypothetical protein
MKLRLIGSVTHDIIFAILGDINLSNFMNRMLVTIVALFASVSCFSQDDTTNLTTWKSHPIPSNEDTLYQYNHSPDNWIVFKKDNEIHAVLQARKPQADDLPFAIERTPEYPWYTTRGHRSAVKVDDGYLVAFFAGEFGGHLHWFSDDGQKRKLISGALICQFIKRGNKIYAIEGLAHLSSSRGSVVELKKTGDKWGVSTYRELPFAPYACQLDASNNMIIVTSGNLLSVDMRGNMNTLINDGFWSHLYPTSVVIHNNVCYVGMRKGIFKFDLLTKKEEWLLPK